MNNNSLTQIFSSDIIDNNIEISLDEKLTALNVGDFVISQAEVAEEIKTIINQESDNDSLSQPTIKKLAKEVFNQRDLQYSLQETTLSIGENSISSEVSTSEEKTIINQNQPRISLNVGLGNDVTNNHQHNCQCQACFYPLADSQEILESSNNNALAAPTEYGNTFKLHSNPDANHTIYLDFDGYSISSSIWEGGNSLTLGAYDRDGDASTFNNQELEDIQKMWQRAAEDFAPFNVNVTTEEPADLGDLTKNGSGDTRWGIRVAMTDNINLDTGAKIQNAGGGGTAYFNSFNWSKDEVALVFNKGAYAGGETISHEVGHALNLRHDGQGSTVYYAGHGSGETSWGPIMGAAFQGNDDNVTQWSRGSLYYNGNEDQDDLSVITTFNGFSYLNDDHGDSNNNSSNLALNTENTFGIIERNDDIDVFEFSINSGTISFDINPASRAFIADGNSYDVEYLDTYGPNLDIWAGIYDSSNSLVAESNPTNSLSANFTDLFLNSGTYYLHIDGVGFGNPLASNPTGFDDYGSLGQYTIDNTFETELVTNIVGTANDDSLIGGVGDETIDGLGGNDTLTGAAGQDILDGGSGIDRMLGGADSDLYYVDNNSDVIVENSNEGYDRVISSADYTIQDNVEELTLNGNVNLKAIGNSVDNVINGNAGNNNLKGKNGDDLLVGNAGNDRLYGDSGNDTMIGGQGNDQFYIDNPNDVIQENPNEGSDTVRSVISYNIPANFEKLILTGKNNINGTGNSLNNNINGNSGNNIISGGAGNDILNGKLGSDTMIGGSGNDQFYIDNLGDVIEENPNEGSDTVRSVISYNIPANFERLILTGQNDIDGTGNSLDNNITGNNGNNFISGGAGNDILNGKLGNDTMIGGQGNDRYEVNNVTDQVQEDVNGGYDQVRARVSYSLTENVEKIILLTSNDIDAIGNNLDNSINGNKGSNNLIGNQGNDTLTGKDGDDTLDGGSGIDRMSGGRDNDLYYVDNSNDVVREGNNQGQDTIISSVSYQLKNNVEVLILANNDDINGTGSGYDEEITGNNGDNQLDGNGGNDTLTGNGGVDTLEGGKGDDQIFLGGNDFLADTIKYQSGDGKDMVFGFEAAIDLLSFKGINFIDVQVIGNDTQLKVGNGITNDANFAQGDLLVTLAGVNNLSNSELGAGGSSLSADNTASFFFS